MADFAIIGAGLAGISLAHKLKLAGHTCSVFEKSRGLGGRLATRRLDAWQADHGAQYFTATSPAFSSEVGRWLDKGWIKPWTVTPWLLTREHLGPSPDQQERFVGIPNMNAMVHGLAAGTQLYMKTRIDRLEADGDQWRLWDEHGEHYGNYDAVILTAPMAQSQALLPTEVINAAMIGSQTMTPTWAMALAFEQPTGIEADVVFVKDGIVSWAARDTAKPGRPQNYETWVLHFSPQWSANHLDASPDLLQQQVLEVLERLAKAALPNIYQSFSHRWLYARAASSEPVHQWHSASGIGLAGDWTQGNRIEDAWTSANSLAAILLKAYA
ncbi:NAD(P)/FAD-dependent oxidoreductase [Reinekea sp.]|jgi:predicted NAD/FAD-dependent oxidoreductase|uniref:NAD(P)/FAD-dependent oxidoreductase n=1 Tax=Reinekea sp. TaxID=1970455 RepID=UPI002A80E44A|nr:FAD-dependent oxidoreductase [Reinekea sp.]